MKIFATLPYPPSVNHYWTMGNGRIYISAEGRAYTRQVDHALRHCPRVSGMLRVSILTSPPDHRRRDVDNVLKCLLDSVTKAGLWEDDSQIIDLSIQRGEPTPPVGSVEVCVEEIKADHPAS